MTENRKYLTNKYSILLTILCFFAYGSSYFGKYSYNANMNIIMNQFSVSHAEAGLVATFFFISYGLGQFIHGALSKKYNERIVIPLVLFLSGVVNFVFTLVTNFTAVKYLWLINGCLLGALWPTLSGCLLRDIHFTQRRRAMYGMVMSTQFGILSTYGSSSIFSLFNNYKLSFYTSSILLTVVAVAWIFLYRKIKSPEHFVEYSVAEEKKVESKSIYLWTGITLFAVFAAVAILFNQFEREGLTSWTPTIMNEMFGKSDSLSIICSLVLPLVAITSPLCIELIGKKVKTFYGKIIIFFIIGTIFCSLILVGLKVSSFGLTLAAFILIYFTLTLIDNLIASVAPVILRDKFDAGVISGFLNGFAYVGSALSTFLIGLVVDKAGWNVVFILYVCLLGLLAAASVAIHIVESIKNKNNQQNSIN